MPRADDQSIRSWHSWAVSAGSLESVFLFYVKLTTSSKLGEGEGLLLGDDSDGREFHCFSKIVLNNSFFKYQNVGRPKENSKVYICVIQLSFPNNLVWLLWMHCCLAKEARKHNQKHRNGNMVYFHVHCKNVSLKSIL